MPDANVAVGAIAFLLVAGYAALAWLRHGRDPVYRDDASVLLPAPPPGMTAATATVVAGGGGQVAFMAALLDLASRDEIAFVVEGRDGRRDRVGIAFHGAETTDPRVLLNRRNPIGEGESWLLGELKAWTAMAGRDHTTGDEPPPPEVVAAGMQMMASFMRAGLGSAEDDDSPAARSAREHGLSSLGMPDAAMLERAYEARTGHPMNDKARERLDQMMSRLSVVADPAAMARDPDHVAAMLESNAERPLTPDEHQQVREQVAAWAERATAAPMTPAYMPAAEARRVRATFLFGTLLQTYAKRHGWIGGLPLLASLRWFALGAVEVAAGFGIAIVGASIGQDAFRSAGGGVALGGFATFVIARAMPALSQEGAMMKAQLAAYRRTLAATFAQATTLDEVVASHRLPWLETPDQSLVWGVALGLRREIEELLSRTARLMATSPASSGAYVPAWYGATSPGATPAPATASTAVEDPSAMFAGIESIGSEGGATRTSGG